MKQLTRPPAERLFASASLARASVFTYISILFSIAFVLCSVHNLCMYRDPRGGHNRKVVNENFFKIWSPQMAYVLGFIFADGAILDVRHSARTCYIHLANNDKSILEQMKSCLSSNHTIQARKPRIALFGEELFSCSESFHLRIGNKIMYDDLLNLGVTPRKSLTMVFPDIPTSFLSFFLRGYFDGDGNIYFGIVKDRRQPRLRINFVSGSPKFLTYLGEKLKNVLQLNSFPFYKNSRAFRLSYSKHDSLKILRFMYRELDAAPYLERKYKVYQKVLKS